MGIRRPSEQLIVLAAGDRYRFLATCEDTGGAYALWHAFIPPLGGPPLHVHSREDERFDVLSGTVRFRVGDDTIDAAAGDSLFAPRGVPHAFRNLGDEPAEMLLHVTPGGLDAMFTEFGRVTNDPDAPPEPATDDEIARIHEVAARYGIEVLGPPIR